jgi:hypothetical protein
MVRASKLLRLEIMFRRRPNPAINLDRKRREIGELSEGVLCRIKKIA